MASKKSEKHNLDESSQLTKSKLTKTPSHLNSNKVSSSKTHNKNSTPLTGSLSSTSSKANIEDIILILYDPEIDKTDNTKLTTDELREINDCVKQYSDQNKCVDYIQEAKKEKIFLITSGKAAVSLLTEIKYSKQVDSIFIFCSKHDEYQHLLQEYNRIVGIYYDRSALIDSIKKNVDLLQKRFITFSFFNDNNKTIRNITKEHAEFLWFQLLKDVILRLTPSNQAKEDLINFCREYHRRNEINETYIIEFEQLYKSAKCINWYTRETFLYKIVNQALRTEDVHQLQTFRFFISDLSSKLAKLRREEIRQQKTYTKLYRGLQLDNKELERFKENKGSIISANGFLSTSRSRTIAVSFAKHNIEQTKRIPVLYEIECSLNTSESVVFADITDYSAHEEEEVLFDLGSTFEIKSISRNKKSKIYVVELITVDAGMRMAQEYIELNRKTNEETTSDILFGVLLIQMGKYDQSITYFEKLKESSGKVDKARIHHEIGSAYLCKDELNAACEEANRAYQEMIKTKGSRIKDSSRPLAIMAHVYLRREMYEESLDLYFEALEIREKFYGRKHLDTASALNNTGNVYLQKEDYPSSLEYYKKAFCIFQELPPVHLYRAVSLNNLGLVRWKMEDVDSALDYHRQALDIRKKLLPPDHNHIIQSLHNLVHIFYKTNRIDESLEYFTELLRIREKNFDLKNRKLVSCLEEYFRPGSPDTPVVFASTDHAHVICWKPPDESHAKILCRELHGNILCRESHAILCAGEAYRETHTVCELGVKQLSTADKERIKLKQQEDLAILEDFIETLISDSDYHRVLEKVEKILMDSSQYCISGYNHTGYLMMRFGDLVRDAYNSDDKSMKALHFYDKVQFILKNKISRWANTKYVQDICFKRIEQKQIHDYFILTKLIDILKNDANYDMGLEIVKNLLMESSQPLISGYNHTEYLMTRFGDLAMDAYDSDDNSIKAFCFYDKVRFILKKKISHWANTEDIENMCSKRIEQKKIHDRSILKKPTDILSKGGDYDMAFERMKGVLMESCQPFISGYNHTEYLMTCLLPLVMNTHDSYDESIKALDFYEKIQFILENVISRWGNTDYIQIIFLERIGHIRQINNRYESAIECFERSVKMQREHEKSLIDIPDTLRSIGLLHMTLGNYEPAKASFEETRKLLQSDFPEKEREIRLLNKRINQATEGLKL